MECDDPDLLRQWIERWKDLVDFEIIPALGRFESPGV
jgi:hypothetical protein